MSLEKKNSLLIYAQESRAWPFEEAKKLIKRFEKKKNFPKIVTFETGYGPSGLPHIGTFGEVVRTTMVKNAFEVLAPGIETRLICFSDDMDALRKVPENVPQRDLLQAHLGMPLTQVPDPFGQHASFAAHNNARLRNFLDHYGFSYTFMSATTCYQSGLFNDTLKKMLAHYKEILDIMLPSLREERQATYSPFLPLCPTRGKILLVPLVSVDEKEACITYKDPETGENVTVSVLDGQCKLQWKADWAMRWMALNVHYEMSGKDLIDSFALANKICQAIGQDGPEKFHYELFLDEEGKKISKSKGNGLSIEEWLVYAPPESLKYFMYQAPRVAKKLYFDIIPKTMDDYIEHMRMFETQNEAQRLNNPIWHLNDHHQPSYNGCPLSFSLLLELVKATCVETESLLWGFITRYVPDIYPGKFPLLDLLVTYAVAYFHQFVKQNLHYRKPLETERIALVDLKTHLSNLIQESDVPPSAEVLQNLVYQVGKDHHYEDLKGWFKALYEILLGQSHGPRFGSFIALYGVKETCELIEKNL